MGKRNQKTAGSLKEEAFPQVDRDNDYVFRFDLSAENRAALFKDPVIEMVRQQLCNILDVIELISNGQTVTVDGFRFLGNHQDIYPIYKKISKRKSEP